MEKDLPLEEDVFYCILRKDWCSRDMGYGRKCIFKIGNDCALRTLVVFAIDYIKKASTGRRGF